MKVYIIASDDAIEFQNAINNFIKGKDVVSIEYQVVRYSTRDGFGPEIVNLNNRALIIYKEG